MAFHEIPAAGLSHPALEFIQAGYPAPAAELEADKRRKLLLALRRERELGSSHVMFLDSDDLVSTRLAEFVTAATGYELSVCLMRGLGPQRTYR